MSRFMSSYISLKYFISFHQLKLNLIIPFYKKEEKNKLFFYQNKVYNTTNKIHTAKEPMLNNGEV